MLDMKHKNIGATVSLIHMIHKLSDSDELPKEMAELFMLESDDCDHKHETKQCTFHAEEDLTKGDSFTTFPCCVGECPLGSILDKELKDNPGLPALGPCAHCGCAVNMGNVAHVDDDIQICKTCFDDKGV